MFLIRNPFKIRKNVTLVIIIDLGGILGQKVTLQKHAWHNRFNPWEKSLHLRYASFCYTKALSFQFLTIFDTITQHRGLSLTLLLSIAMITLLQIYLVFDRPDRPFHIHIIDLFLLTLLTLHKYLFYLIKDCQDRHYLIKCLVYL